ncbi:hypothetical protein [Pseudonocardia sp. GCM10023141]|uniref:hypothetical protein n=1 Tax=Pseudonocardia sp. GCM10023141 TaxID=3252653 RepID=UPI00360D66FB
MDDDNMMLDSPMEFLSGLADAEGAEEGGYCLGQSILDAGDHYACHCSCGSWDVRTGTREEGLRLARLHTADS